MKNQYLIITACLAVLIFSFQNCAKTNFKSEENANLKAEDTVDPNGNNGGGGNTPPPPDAVDLGNAQKFSCKQFIELTYDPAQVVNVPKRDAQGLCYVMKIVSAANFNPSTSISVVDQDVVSRDHDNQPNSHHPYVMGSAVVRMNLAGERSIKLSGGKDDKTKITVDNFILIGVAPSSVIGNASYYKAYGTSDSALYGKNHVLFKNSEVAVKAFATGGVSTIDPLQLEGVVEYNKEYSLDIRALDAGQVGNVSDIYVLFQ